MFSFGASPPSASGRSRLILNKRVAFPLQSNQNQPHNTQLPPSGPTNITGPGNMPPTGPPVSSHFIPTTSTMHQPSSDFSNFQTPPLSLTSSSGYVMAPPPSVTNSLPPMSMPPFISVSNPIYPTATLDSCDNIPEDEMKLITFATLKTAFTCIPHALKHQNPEIQRRIDTLQSTWNDLDHKIKIILYKISKSIENQDIEEATAQHRVLVVDHHNACAVWAPALRQLILLSVPHDPDSSEPRRNSMTPITTPLMVPTMSDDQATGGLSEVTSGDSGSKKKFSRVYHI